MLEILFPPATADLSVLSLPAGYTDRDCDGCGTGWNEPIVPDTIYGLSVKPACCVHDWEFMQGGLYSDFEAANWRFFQNLLALINSVKAWWYPKALARRRALLYYEAVERFGWEIFEANNKRLSEELKLKP